MAERESLMQQRDEQAMKVRVLSDLLEAAGRKIKRLEQRITDDEELMRRLAQNVPYMEWPTEIMRRFPDLLEPGPPSTRQEDSDG